MTISSSFPAKARAFARALASFVERHWVYAFAGTTCVLRTQSLISVMLSKLAIGPGCFALIGCVNVTYTLYYHY